MRRDPRDGVVLINVLVMLGLTAAVVFVMVSLADLSIARSQRLSEASQALALLRAGEHSAMVALRRDMVEAPEIDHPGEAWAAVGQEPVEVAGGAFSLTITDAQHRYNVNGLATAGLLGTQILQAIAAALELPPETAGRIAATITRDGPVGDLAELTGRAGIPPEELAALARFMTALPGRTEVNINAASAELIAVLLQNPVPARVLVSIRERQGALTPEDVGAAGVILPPGLGYGSAHFRVEVSARVGETVQMVESLLQRRRGTGGTPEVAVIRRKTPAAAVLPPPPQ